MNPATSHLFRISLHLFAELTDTPNRRPQAAKDRRIDGFLEWCRLENLRSGVKNGGQKGNFQQGSVQILSRSEKKQPQGLDGREPRPLPSCGGAAATETDGRNGSRRFEARFAV